MQRVSYKTFISIIVTRIALNLGYRILYPFLPAISRGLGISFERAAFLASVRSFVGLTSPIFGRYIDKISHNYGMAFGVCVFVMGVVIFIIYPCFWTILAMFTLFGLAKAIYDPSVQAYISSFVSYDRRAKALGITELSWSGSWFIGIPLSAVLMKEIDWKAPFVFVGIVGTIMLFATVRFPKSAESLGPYPGCRSHAKVPLNIYLVLGMSFFMLLANENLVIVYGAWMEQSFQVKIVSLGFVSLIIGMGELAGELVVTFWGDKVGKRNLLYLGLCCLGILYLIILTVSSSISSIQGATLTLTVVFFSSELSIVASFPFVSEILPHARAKILSLNYASAIGGRFVGSFTGPWLWHFYSDIRIPALVSFVCIVLSTLFLLCYGWLSSKEPGC